jgi:hypothetical protein
VNLLKWDPVEVFAIAWALRRTAGIGVCCAVTSDWCSGRGLWLKGKEESGDKRDGIYVPYSTETLTLEVLQTSPISIYNCSGPLI